MFVFLHECGGDWAGEKLSWRVQLEGSSLA